MLCGRPELPRFRVEGFLNPTPNNLIIRITIDSCLLLLLYGNIVLKTLNPKTLNRFAWAQVEIVAPEFAGLTPVGLPADLGYFGFLRSVYGVVLKVLVE